MHKDDLMIYMLALMHNFIGLNLQPLNAIIKYVDNMLIYEMLKAKRKICFGCS